MFSKIKKYVIGFFVLCGGILVAFLSGKSAGKKDEKLKGLKKDSKRVSNALIVITKNILIGSAQIIDLVRPVFLFVGTAISNLFTMITMLPAGIREHGKIGYLM